MARATGRRTDYYPRSQRGYHLARTDDLEMIVAVVHAEYQHRLAMANAVDFDDLIGRTVELLRSIHGSPDTTVTNSGTFLSTSTRTPTTRSELIRELAGVDAQTVRQETDDAGPRDRGTRHPPGSR